jgi:hypothetical protein
MAAAVAAPLLDWSQRGLQFSYVCAPGAPAAVSHQCLEMRNVSMVPLSFTLQTAPPFAVDTAALALQPGEGAGVEVSFDPEYR